MPINKDKLKKAKGTEEPLPTLANAADAETEAPKKGGRTSFIDRLGITKEELRNLSEWGFYERGNAYFMREPKDEIIDVSNFTMEVLYHISSKTDPKRIVKITNVHGVEKLVEFSTSDMVSPDKFKCVVESQGNFLFWGKPQHLAKIKSKLFNEECSSKEVRVLGWQPESKVYAFCNGVYNGKFTPIDDYGIVKLEKHNYFLPVMSKINIEYVEEFAAERKFFYHESNIGFEKWANLFTDVYGENGVVGLAFYLSSIFRDVIFARLNFFPMLFLFGSRGTGKSTMARSLMSMFGYPQEPFMLGTPGTQKAFLRMFAQFRNAMVWLDEYKNSIDQRMIEAIKPIYDGTGYSRATFSNDNRTKTTPILSGCVISGQEMPTAEPALFSRVLLLQYIENNFTPDAVRKFNQLTELEREGLSSVTAEILKHREQIEQQFNTAFDARLVEFTNLPDNALNDDRLQKNASILVTIYSIIEKYHPLPYTAQQLANILLEKLSIQAKLMNTSNDQAKFWDIVQYLFEQNLIQENVDFKFKDDMLYMRFSRIHPLYLEYYRRLYNMRGIDQSSLMQYIKADRTLFKGMKDNVRFGDSAPTSCYVFDHHALPIKLQRTTNTQLHGVDEDTKPTWQAAAENAKIIAQNDDEPPF